MAQAAVLDNFEGGEDDVPLKPPAASNDTPVIDARDITLKEGAGGYGRGAGMPATPAPGTDVDPKGIFEGLTSLREAKAAQDDKDSAESVRAAQGGAFRQHQAYNAEVATSHDIPTWDEEAMKKKFRTAPVQAFGSVGSVFAMLASAFTRRPMTNALNAGATALDAIKAGDRQAYEDAHTAWKDNVDLAVKRFNMEHTEFQDAAALMNTDMAAAKAAMTATALKFDDQKALFLLKNGYDKELFSLMADRAKSVGEMEVAANNTTMFQQQQVAFKAQMAQYDKAQKPDDMDQETWNNLQAARRLTAAVRILGDQGKMTPISRGMLLFAQEHPNATFEEWSAAMEKLQGAGKLTAEETQAIELKATELQQAAAARGETLSRGDALIQATAEMAKAKGAAALDRTRLTQEGQDRRAQLSADTRTAIAQLSASTRQEIVEMQQGGQNARTEFSANARKELAVLSAASRKEIEEMREKAKVTSGRSPTNAQRIAGAVNRKIQEWRSQGLSEDEIDQRANAYQKQMLADSAPLTANQRDALESQFDRLTYSDQTIGKLETLLKKHNIITGLGGKVLGRPTEIMANVLGGSNNTDYKQFESYISELKEWAPRLLNESRGRPLAAEESQIAAIVPGLSIGDTKQHTADQLNNLMKLFKQMQGRIKQRIEGVWTPPDEPASSAPAGGAPAASSSSPAAPWLNDPKVK